METTEKQILTLSGDGYGLTIKRDAIELKEGLLRDASAVQQIESEQDVTQARGLVKQLAAFRNQLEKSRKAVKEPVLEVGRKIDAAAEKFGAEIVAEEKRITALGQAYAAEQERVRREVAEKMRREAEEAARKAAEEARIMAEKAATAEAALRKSQTVEADAVRRAEAEMQRRIEAEREAARLKIEAQAVAQASIFDAPAVAGTKAEVDYEITDIIALQKAAPQLVELTPKRAAILAFLKASPGVQVPGIKIVEKIKFR